MDALLQIAAKERTVATRKKNLKLRVVFGIISDKSFNFVL